ncbi:hypothetical protein JTB14_004579 [Gonioctena quinquepunctata]|nr:hypothetical protein JTB14_004579 [Gonioctena quinquepunctata]
MVMCWAPGCHHYNQREVCKFFKFPKDPQLKKKWILLVRRDIEPGPGAFLCSCHFIDGKRENGPQLFEHNRKKRFNFSTPEKRKRSATNQKDGVSTASATARDLERTYDQPQPSTSSQCLTFSVPAPEQLEPQPSTSYEDSTLLGTDFVEAEYVPEPDPQPSTSQNLAGFSAVLVEAGNYFLQQELLRNENELANLKERMSFDHIKNNLAQRFNISQASVSNIIIPWVHVLQEILFKKLMAKIPERKKNRSCLPNCCSTFTNCRIIIDCTEIYTMASRKSMTEQKVTYSSYKHRNTWKGLIGVAPNGVITYISGLYPGSTSDKKIVQHCGILDQLAAGDLILADKGFLIRDILPPGVMLNLPPFLTTAQFTPQQTLRPYAQEVFQLVGALTNLQYPLIKEVEEYFISERE